MSCCSWSSRCISIRWQTKWILHSVSLPSFSFIVSRSCYLHMRRCFRDKSCATSLARCWLIKPISSTLEWLLWGNMASLHLSLLPLILYVDYFLSNKCCQWQRHECRESWMHTLEHQLIRGFSVTASVTDLICVPFLRRRICKLNLR